MHFLSPVTGISFAGQCPGCRQYVRDIAVRFLGDKRFNSSPKQRLALENTQLFIVRLTRSGTMPPDPSYDFMCP